MIKFNTSVRALYTVSVFFLLGAAAHAQTILNFATAAPTGAFSAVLTVANPTTEYADVQFTLYSLDGNPVSGRLVNPVRYRVAPKGQIVMRQSEIFAGPDQDGWVQATSPSSGLTGSYLLSAVAGAIEAASPAAPLLTQVVPYLREDGRSHTQVVLVNPGAEAANVTVTFYGPGGGEVATAVRSLNGHGAARLEMSSLAPSAGDNVSARVSASQPVAASAWIQRDAALLTAAGQSVEPEASVWIAPHFVSGNGFDPRLILHNPAGSPVSAVVTLFGPNGGAPISSVNGPVSRTWTIPANGSVSLGGAELAGRLLFGESIDGWLRVDSVDAPLEGLVILDQVQDAFAIPLQSRALRMAVYSAVPGGGGSSAATGLELVNPTEAPVSAGLFLIGTDGRTIAAKTIEVPAGSKVSKYIRDVLPDSTATADAYLFVHSDEALYGAGLIGGPNGALAAVAPSAAPAGFAADGISRAPAIVKVAPSLDVAPGMTLQVWTSTVGDMVFLLRDQIIQARQFAPGVASFLLDIPSMEPGLAKLRFRSHGVESEPIVLRILLADNPHVQMVSGRAFYQKIDVTDSGLDVNHPVMLPIRNSRVELVNTASGSLVAVSETDNWGRYTIPLTADPNLSVRVVSRLASSSLRVGDNTNLNALYSAAVDVDGREPPPEVVLTEASRTSGAFNILEMIQRANETVNRADPRVMPPAVQIFWSTRNTNRYGNPAAGLIGTSMFNLANGTAYILGDRATDSDEFDDAVIIHEYAHLLAAQFSRDDSPGGPHGLGDMLDPRVAWSEGWANFFSSVVRNDSVWRDTGANGKLTLRFDVEENVPAGDHPGYWSEASVESILWDIYGFHRDAADAAQLHYSFQELWSAFIDLRNERFVYLPYFLEHFMARNPSAADALRTIVQARSIDFQPDERPSVAYPFPKPINTGTPAVGTLDSLTPQRPNLITSSHFYSFSTEGGAATVRMDITGTGPGGNLHANDLDLFLFDLNGRLIAKSDTGLNGQSERIARQLPAGTYVIEIRSYYSRAETGGFVFNSADYRVSVSAP